MNGCTTLEQLIDSLSIGEWENLMTGGSVHCVISDASGEQYDGFLDFDGLSIDDGRGYIVTRNAFAPTSLRRWSVSKHAYYD
jgi:hypothetical protein